MRGLFRGHVLMVLSGCGGLEFVEGGVVTGLRSQSSKGEDSPNTHSLQVKLKNKKRHYLVKCFKKNTKL